MVFVPTYPKCRVLTIVLVACAFLGSRQPANALESTTERKAQQGNAPGESIEERAARMIHILSLTSDWVSWRGGGELCVLAAQDKSGRIGRIVLRSLAPANQLSNAASAQFLAPALAGTTGVSGKDVVDTFKDALRAIEQPAVGPEVGDNRVVERNRIRELLLLVLESMGHRAADAVPFLLNEIDTHKDDPGYIARIRLVLAIAGHESQANISKMAKAMEGKEFRKRYVDDPLSLMATLPLGDVVPESIRGDIASALVDYLSSPQVDDDGTGRAAAAIALARLGVSNPHTIAVLKDLMHGVHMPRQLPDVLLSEDNALPIWSYVTYGYAIACLDATQQKTQTREILDMAGRYKVVFPIDAGLGYLGSMAPQGIIDDALDILSEGDSPAALGAVSLLYGIGGHAPASAQEKVLAVLKQSKERRLRAHAVEAFGAVAEPSMAATLVDLAAHEKSQEIKELMLETSKRLRLFGSQPPTDEELGIAVESSEHVY